MIYVARPVEERHGRQWSWHILRTWSRAPGVAVTVCGRRIDRAIEHPGLPSGRTCETCFRIVGA